MLNLPDYVFAAGMLSIGYPEKKPELRKRLPMETIVHKNEYQKLTDKQINELYSEWMSNWTKFYDRLSDEKKKKWNEEKGVYNNAQYITKTVYTVELLKELGEKVIANIRGAKYEI
jgi:hypothetical protein